MNTRLLLLCAPSLIIASCHGSRPPDPGGPVVDAGDRDASVEDPVPGADASRDAPDSTTPHPGACAGLAAGLTCSTPYCIDDYSVTDLGPPAGNGSIANAIDDSGNVAGTFRTTPGGSELHAFRWSARDGFVDLGTLGGATSQGLGISGARVVGVSDVAGGGAHAFLSDEQGMHDLGTLGGTQSIARSVNAAGVAVGESQLASGIVHATRFEGGAAVDLETPTGPAVESAAYAINAAGVIVGSSGRSSAVQWTNGTKTYLETSNGKSSVATAVNSNGVVAGGVVLGVIGYLAFEPVRFAGGTVSVLGTPAGSNAGTATGINDAGVIVGSSRLVSPEITLPRAPFVFDGTSVSDLNDRISLDALTEYRTISSANAINNAGQIAAANFSQAVILTPHCSPAPPFRSLAFATGKTVAAPDGTAAGDFLVGALRYAGDPVALTPPDGWSLVADQLAGAGTAKAFHMLVYVHTATAEEPRTYTFAKPDGVQLHVQIAAYPGLSTVERAVAISYDGTAIATPEVTTSRNNVVVIGIFMGASGARWSRAAGMIARMTPRSNVDGISLQDEMRPTAGGAGGCTSFTFTTSGPLAAAALVLR